MSPNLIPPFLPRLGPFRVGAKIGGGGMSTVFLGRREKEDEPGLTLVALKVIRTDLANNKQYVDMFNDEAHILARFDHPGIIKHVDFGQTDSHQYLAMELVLGRSLMDAWEVCNAENKTMPVELAAHVVILVAEALDYAHFLTDESGKHLMVIHRDVNPANIFVTYDGQVKLIDFGLAKARGRTQHSSAGVLKGKVPYLSPEQITEDEIDLRTDVYALGATLWEITTGKRLFKRPTDLETIRAIRAHEIPDPRTLVDHFYPESLCQIIVKALAKDPDERFATAGEMARALRSVLAEMGKTEPLQAALAAWLEELFPGEHKKQAAWLIEAADDALAHVTMQPPVPLADVPEVVIPKSALPATVSVPASVPVPVPVPDSDSVSAPASASDSVSAPASSTPPPRDLRVKRSPLRDLMPSLLLGLFLGVVAAVAYFAVHR